MNNNTLDFNSTDLRNLLDRTTELVVDRFANITTQRAYHNLDPEEVESWFDEGIPNEGMPVDELLEVFKKNILDVATGNVGPHMYGYVMSGGNQIALVADKLASLTNQNVAKWHLSPSVSEIDKTVIRWASQLIGFPGNSGFLGTSGSAANLDGLTVARNIFLEKSNLRENGLFGTKPILVYCSKETHNSIDKSLQVLGIGTNHLRKIPTNSDYAISLDLLDKQIRQDLQDGLQPFCIIGNAGTVNTGAIDDLEGISLIAKKYNLWFHIDGAYGGLVAGLESKKTLFKGIELADSIALDFHKWLYQSFEVGCLLVKDWDQLRRAFFIRAPYLDTSLEKGKGRLNFNEHHFLLSRNAKSLKVWMTIKAFGMKRIKSMILKDIALTKFLNELITKAADFKLIASSELAISCFQYTGNMKQESEVNELNRRLISALEEDGRVFITGTILNDKQVLRACFINHRKNKETTKYLLEVIRDVGQGVQSQIN